MERKVYIQEKFKVDAKRIHDYIKKESPQNAKKFKQELPKQMEKIEKHPQSFSLIDYDDFDNSSQEYRYSHFMKTFKIIYKLPVNFLIYLGIIHDKQDVKAIKDIQKAEEV